MQVSECDVVPFDGGTQFTGTDDEKIAQVNAWNAGLSPRTPRPACLLPARRVEHSTPIELWSGSRWVGARGPAREHGTGSVLHYRGPSSQLTFVRNDQGYPSDGSPRDVSFVGVQFAARPDVDWMPRHDPTSSPDRSGRVLWMSTIRDCGWVGFATVWWGWSDGTAIGGITHVQAVAGTPFNLGGSETTIGGTEISFADNSTASWAMSGLPLIRSSLSKSRIAGIMLTARGDSFQVQVEGGEGLVLDGVLFDSPASHPSTDRALLVTGGRGLTVTRCHFTGWGAAATAPIVLRGGGDVVVDANTFALTGARPAPDTSPVVHAEAAFAGCCAVGLNNQTGYAARRVRQARAGQLVCTDPRVEVITDP